METIRLDALAAKQFHISAEEAAGLIMAGRVFLGGVPADKPGTPVPADSLLTLKEKARKYASRSGYKLAKALDVFAVDPAGMTACDIGASNGGFTDCLLQAGASRVAALDLNYGQLAWKIRQDPRVAVFERTNIKDADPAEVGAPFDLIVIDVSFIGLAALAPLFPRFSRPGTIFIGLVKPQFESAHDETDRGVVRDEAVRLRTVEEVKAALAAAGFTATGVVESPITGPEGNVEYLVRAVFRNKSEAI